MVLRVSFLEPQVIAYDLEPKRVTNKKKKVEKFVVEPVIKISGIETRVGVSSDSEYEVLEPMIIAYGLGESVVSWEYRESDQDDGIAVGTSVVGISLCVPSGKKRVHGTINGCVANFPKVQTILTTL